LAPADLADNQMWGIGAAAAGDARKGVRAMPKDIDEDLIEATIRRVAESKAAREATPVEMPVAESSARSKPPSASKRRQRRSTMTMTFPCSRLRSFRRRAVGE
jgi:hypothetical protein